MGKYPFFIRQLVPVLVLCLAALPAPAQSPEMSTENGLAPAQAGTPLSQGLLDPNLRPVADMNAQPTPLLQQETAAATGNAPTPAPRLMQLAKLDFTWLPSSNNGGLEIDDVELSATFGVPLADGWAPLLLTPGAAAHFWKVPALTPGPADLPSNLYDLYVDIGWRPRLARWLFADLGITPGVYSDFKDVSADSFQLRGRGLAIVALSEQWQFVGGALYVNRNHTKVLPAGGVIWNPNPDTRCLLVFPQPKLSHHFFTLGKTQWWGYLAGEFGGGRWSIERGNGAMDYLDYTDWRVYLGVECVGASGLKGHLEAGYVFNRTVNFTSATPDFNPDATVMLRVGLSY